MEIITLGLISVFGVGYGVGLFVWGIYVGMQIISINKYLDNAKEKIKAIKKREPSVYISQMTDQEVNEREEGNSVDKINKTVI